MLNSTSFAAIACSIVGSLTIVTVIGVYKESEQVIESYKSVATAVIQVAGGAVGGYGYAKSRNQNQSTSKGEDAPSQVKSALTSGDTPPPYENE